MSDWSQAEFHAERAHQFYEAGQWDKALTELRLALTIDPSQSDWHFGMGLTLDALGQHDQAIESFEEVLRLRGDDIETMLHLAADYIRTEQCPRAIDILAKVSLLEPNCEPAYCHRVLAYTRLGDHEQAEQMFYLARQITDECPLCYDHLAHSLAMRGELDRAIWCWQQVLRIDPHYPGVNARLAQSHWRRGQLERAYQYFLQQLREDAGDIDTLLQTAVLLIELGRHAEAREKLRRVLELNPTVAAAHFHLGELSLRTGHFDAATAELEMAGRLDPALAGVNLGLARVARRRGQFDAARAFLRTELDLTDHRPSQVLEMADLLIDLRLPQPAISLLSPLIAEARELNLSESQLANAHFYRGAARMLVGKVEDGIGDCRRALRLAPRHDVAMQNLVLAYLEQHRLDRAGYWLRRAEELRPDDLQLRQLGHRLMRARMWAFLRRCVSRLLLRASRRRML